MMWSALRGQEAKPGGLHSSRQARPRWTLHGLRAEEAIALYVETLRERGWKVPQDNPRVEVDMTEASEVYVYRLHVREAHAVA